MNSDVTYVVVSASPGFGYTHTNHDIIDPEIHHVDGSVHLLHDRLRMSVCMT